MELGKVTPVTADTAATRAEAALSKQPGSGETGSAATAAAAATGIADEVNIHPLDVAGALQILIAEVRASLTVPGDVPVRGEYSTQAGPPTQTTTSAVPLLLVQMLLKHLPEDEAQAQAPAAWLAAATQAEASLRSGLDKAVDAVMAWRNVPALVVDAARDTRAVVLAAVDGDPPSPLWLRPEWLGLAPRMERFWRRRRYARRNLRDPDLYTQMPDG